MQEGLHENSDIFELFANATKPKEINFSEEVLYAPEGQIIKSSKDGVEQYLFRLIGPPESYNPTHRIGYDRDNNKYFLKTSRGRISPNMLRAQGNSALLKQQGFFGIPSLIKNSPLFSRDIIEREEDILKGEEATYMLAKYLGIPMAPTFFIRAAGKGWSAARFIENGIFSKELGITITTEQTRKDIASILLLKFLIGAIDDNGQYMQVNFNRICLIDTQILPTNISHEESSSEMLEFILNESFFMLTSDNIKDLLDAINKGYIDQNFMQASTLDQNFVYSLLGEMTTYTKEEKAIYAKLVERRAKLAQEIFYFLSLPENQEKVISSIESSTTSGSIKNDLILKFNVRK